MPFKILRMTVTYDEYLSAIYARNPEISSLPYIEQKQAIDQDSHLWADHWSRALSTKGNEVFEATYNAEPLQRAWAREHGFPDNLELDQIAVEQVRYFQPDILWYDSFDILLLKKIKVSAPNIRLVIGNVGSAVRWNTDWKEFDAVFSCAPETVHGLQQRNVKAYLISHAFDEVILKRGSFDFPPTRNLTFIGQIVRKSQFHLEREKILERLVLATPLDIYSSIANLRRGDLARDVIKGATFDLVQMLNRLGFSKNAMERLPFLSRATRWQERPLPRVSKKLMPFVKGEIYGLAMFKKLRESKIVLNIHADSSPKHASNMRLFEVTGIGSCLLTDYRPNLDQFFKIDEEIVVYRNVDEAVEKVAWLLDNEEVRKKIALKGQARTLKEHTFLRRADDYMEMISDCLKRKR